MVSWVTVLISTTGALIGALVGGFATYLNQTANRRQSVRERRRALAAGIGAEMRAYIELMERRKHAERAQSRVEALRAGTNLSLKGWLPEHERSWDPFPFFHASLHEIGILGPICGPIARFHTLWSGIRSTILSAEAGAFDEKPLTEKVDIIEADLGLWKEMISLGRDIVRDLDRQAKTG
jgi:hypothetical protein